MRPLREIENGRANPAILRQAWAPGPPLLLQVDRLATTLAVADVERDLLALLDILAPGLLQDGGVQEDVLAAVLRRHEAEAAHLVEPLHRAADRIGRAAGIAVAEVTARRPVAEAATLARRAEAATTPEAALARRAEAAAEAALARRRTIA